MIIETKKKDTLFAGQHYPKPFSFNEAVADVFDDMVRRSVPFYDEVARILLSLAEIYCPNPAKIYDIGCSTASNLLLLSQHLSQTLDLVGIDNSEAMIEKAKLKLEKIKANDRKSLFCQSALDHKIHGADIVICNYTLQFITVRERKRLLSQIYQGLKPGALFFFSEKIRYADAEMQEAVMRIYENYKLEKGYSVTEIERKKESLENVLVPVTLEELIQWLKESGFRQVEVAFKWHCFVTITAMK